MQASAVITFTAALQENTYKSRTLEANLCIAATNLFQTSRAHEPDNGQAAASFARLQIVYIPSY